MRHPHFILLVLWILSSSLLPAQEAPKAPPAKPWQKLEGVTFKPQRWDDGDSFHVLTADGKDLIFRLYFVDTPEAEKKYADRVRDQAAYFGIIEPESLELAKKASEFTREALRQPFTIWTRWRDALGRSKQQRFYAVVITADGKDLAQELVRNGLARIYGTKTILFDGRDSKSYNETLQKLEVTAKAEKKGGWNHTTGTH